LDPTRGTLFHSNQAKERRSLERSDCLSQKGVTMDKKLNILLVCGSGASSGFMAGNMRKAAAKRGLDVSIIARSESEIDSYIDGIDVLMVGPHLAYILDDIDGYTQGYPVKVILMKPEYYSTLDGDAAIDHLLSELDEK
jgi:PTS system cellobiose-specific IIB component